MENIAGIFPNDYALALGLFAGVFLIIMLVFFAVEKAAPKISPDSPQQDNNIKKNYRKGLTVLAVFISAPIALRVLPMENAVLTAANRISYTVISIAAAYTVYSVFAAYLSGIMKRLGSKNELGESLKPILSGIMKILLGALAVVYILGLWGVQIGPLLAGLGIAGLALALALQPLLGNLFNGLALILDETFKVGDVIKLASGEMGTVHRVGLRTTKIKTFDNEMFIIPNTKLADSILQNFFQPDKSIRVSVDFGVEYGTDPEYVKKIGIEEVEKITFIDRSQEIRVLFTEMADSALNFKMLFWVDDISKRWPAHQEAISRIYRRLYEEKIGIPFPQRTVWMRDEGQAKPPSPRDEKFKSVHNKYFPRFGHEYSENDSGQKK